MEKCSWQWYQKILKLLPNYKLYDEGKSLEVLGSIKCLVCSDIFKSEPASFHQQPSGLKKLTCSQMTNLYITFHFREVTNSRWITKMNTAGIPGTILCAVCLQSYSSSVSTRNMLFIFYSEYILLLFPKMLHVQYQHINTA